MLRYLCVFLMLFSFSAYADNESDNVRVKEGFLIVDVSSTRSDVMNLLLKLDQIESVVRSRETSSNEVEYHIVINMDKQNEYIQSNTSYTLRFSNLARSSVVFREIMQALTS